MPQIKLIGPTLKIRLSMSPDKIYSFSNKCGNSPLVSNSAHIVPHGEAQIFRHKR